MRVRQSVHRVNITLEVTDWKLRQLQTFMDFLAQVLEKSMATLDPRGRLWTSFSGVFGGAHFTPEGLFCGKQPSIQTAKHSIHKGVALA